MAHSFPWGSLKPRGWLAQSMSQQWESIPRSADDLEGTLVRPGLFVGGGRGKLEIRRWVERRLASTQPWSPRALSALAAYGEASGDPRVLETWNRLESSNGVPRPVSVVDRLVWAETLETLSVLAGRTDLHDRAVASFSEVFAEQTPGAVLGDNPEAWAIVLGLSQDPRWSEPLDAMVDTPWTLEAATAILRSAVSTDGQTLKVLHYLPLEARWASPAGNFRLEIESADPRKSSLRLELSPEAPTPATLILKMPAWAQGCLITGEGVSSSEVEEETGWMELHRVWQPGESIQLQFEEVGQ